MTPLPRPSALLPVLVLASAAAAQDILVSAPKIVVAPDTVLQDGAILIRGGRVLHVGSEIPAELRDRARKVAYGGTVVPGFVNPHATLGQADDLKEAVTAFTPDLRAADAFDPFGEELQEAARAGVTTCGFPPASGNTLAGIAAVVKTGPEQGSLLAEEAYLKVALVESARDQERYPTSLMGAADLLRQSFDAVRGVEGAGDPAWQVLRQVLAGSRRVVVHAETHAEITTALEICESYGLQPVLLGGSEADESLDKLARLRATVVLAPLSPASSREALELPGKLEKAGVRLAFFGEDPRALRLGAALAVRHGLGRTAALAGLTRVPADLCEVADRVGSLRSGCDADFLVFDGEPLDLDAPLRAIWIRGTRVRDAEEKL